VHDPNKEIPIPPPENKIFAVVSFQGRQHKITKDDIVILDKLPLEVGSVFFFDQVLLVGTNEYTSVGRPYVKSARVLAVVEEKSKTEKVIIFKKRRRKGYQKNMGHRQEVTQVRINKIIHNPSDKIINDYRSLI
jgi:large subunit ribosomal protein L21